MNKIICLCVISLCLFACSGEPDPQASIRISSITTGNENLDSTFQDLSGQALEISSFDGKTVLLNYWATWCAPCIREIPELIKAANILEKDDFIVLMASDESLDTISEFLIDHEFEGNFIKLNTFFASHGVEAVPSTELYSKNGELVNQWLGEYEWGSPEIIAQLHALITNP